MQWWRLAARQGSSQAAYNLGFLYSQEVNEDDDDDDEDSAGNGSLKQDFVEALKWYREAAAAGNTGAEYNLGVMHEQGDGLEAADFSAAAQWYRRAANKDDAQAQCNLGLLCFEGRGVLQSSAEAARWWRLAAAQGDEQAAENLELVDKINNDNNGDTAQGNASNVANANSKVDSHEKDPTAAAAAGEMAASENMTDLGDEFGHASASGSPSDVAAGAAADFAISRPLNAASSTSSSTSSSHVAELASSHQFAATNRALRLAQLKASAKQKRHLLLGADDTLSGGQEGTSDPHLGYDRTLYHPKLSPVKEGKNSIGSGTAAPSAALAEHARAAARLASQGWGTVGMPIDETAAPFHTLASRAEITGTKTVHSKNRSGLHTRFAPFWLAVRAGWAGLRCLARAAVPVLLVCVSFGIAGSSLFGNHATTSTTSSSSSSSSSSYRRRPANHASSEDLFSSAASALRALLLCGATLTCENVADFFLHHRHAASGLADENAMDLYDAPLLARVVFLASFVVVLAAVMLCAAVSTYRKEINLADSSAALTAGITPFSELDSAATLEPSARDALFDAFDLLAEAPDAITPMAPIEVAKDDKKSNNSNSGKQSSNGADSISGNSSGNISGSSIFQGSVIRSERTVSLVAWTAFLSALAELHPIWASQWADEWDEIQPSATAAASAAAASAAAASAAEVPLTSGAQSPLFSRGRQHRGRKRRLPARDAAALSYLIASDFAGSGGSGRRGNDGLGLASVLRWRSVLGLRFMTTTPSPEDATSQATLEPNVIGWWMYATTAAVDLTCVCTNTLSWPLIALVLGFEGYGNSNSANVQPLAAAISWLHAASATVALPGGSAKFVRVGHLEIPFADASLSAAGALDGGGGWSASVVVRWVASRSLEACAHLTEWLASNLTVTLAFDATYMALHCLNVWHQRRRHQPQSTSRRSNLSVGLTVVLARWIFKASAEGLSVVAVVLSSPDQWLPQRSLLLAAAHAVAEVLPQDAAAAVLTGAGTAAQAMTQAAEVGRAPAALWDAYLTLHWAIFSFTGVKSFSSSSITEPFTFCDAVVVLWRIASAVCQVAVATLALHGLFALPLVGLRWWALSSDLASTSATAEVVSSLTATGATTRLTMAAAEATAAAAETVTPPEMQFLLQARGFGALWRASTETLLRIALGTLPCQNASKDYWDLLPAAGGEEARSPWLLAMIWLGRVAVSACFLSIRAVDFCSVGFALVHAVNVFGREHSLAQQRAAADNTLLVAIQRSAEGTGGVARAENSKGAVITEKSSTKGWSSSSSDLSRMSVPLDSLLVSRLC